MNIVKSLGATRLMTMMGVLAATIGFFIYVTMSMTASPMTLLFSDLDPKEAGAIIQELDAQHIPYRVEGDGSVIKVPQDKALALRVTLAQKGLATGGVMGNELFDRGDALGSTAFLQNINQVRALEGELSRTIKSIDRVASARVHLVMPSRELFSSETRKPSASVVIKTQGGSLNGQQVQAITQLVAAAVPDMDPERVAVIDQRGALLTKGLNGNSEAAAQSNMEERRQSFENRTRAQIETLLERTIGPGKVRAEVSAEMDFSRTTLNSETFDPDGQVLRSSNNVADTNLSKDGAGGGGDVSVQNNVPGGPPTAGGAGGNQSNSNRTEEQLNYEISKTVKTQVLEGGGVKRLSVAVIVDGIYTEGKDGKQIYKPRSPQELKQIDAIVRSAIGFDEKRGDTVEIANMKFIEDAPLDALPGPPSLMGIDINELYRFAQLAVLGVVGILVVLLILRPLILKLIASIPQGGAPALAGPGGQLQLPPGGQPYMSGDGRALPEGMTLPQLPPGMSSMPSGVALTGPDGAPRDEFDLAVDIATADGKIKTSALKRVGEMVEKHPDEAMAVVRNWIYEQ